MAFPIKKLLNDFKGFYGGLIIGPVFKLSEAVMELFVPLIMANIIDIGILKKDTNYIFKNVLLMLLIGALGFIFALICQYSASHVAHGYGKALRTRLFKHVFSLSQGDCATIGANTLITRLTNDVNQVQTGINMFIRLAIRAPYLAIGSVVMALLLDFKLGLIFLVSTPIILAILYFVTKISVPYYTKIQAKQDVISRLVSEMVLGSRVIRAFSRQGLEEKEFEAAGDDLTQITVKVGKLSALLHPLTSVVVNLAIVAIVWFGASFANFGAIEPGKILALVSYMTQTMLALIVLSNVLIIFSKAFASAKRISDLLDEKSSISMPNSLQKEANGSLLQFKNVTFSYNQGEPALSNINFNLEKGQTLGIIGGTGCGKTTIARLLLRFYDVNTGEILINGINVKDYPKEELVNEISYVPQGSTLFSGTIKDNLLMGKPLTDEHLWNALKIAQGSEFVQKLENGLNSCLTEGGKNLSGGQRQRLCIARAIAKNSPILILDDASSALDYATDAALRRELKQNIRDKAVIYITQRAASLLHADLILVLDDGEAAGIGTHEQLLNSCKVYKEICNSQGIVQEVIV